jgi:hypothetical protein
MKVEVSLGEAIDKLNILELKLKKISNQEKIIEIQKEINELNECQQYKSKYIFFYNLLTFVNEYIWDTTDKIKSLKSSEPNFGLLSNNIFEYNQKRFRIKNWFNLLESSNIKEQKSYGLKYVNVTTNSIDTIYDKIPEINCLLLDFDIVYFINSDSNLIQTMKKIFKQPTLKFIDLKIMDNKETTNDALELNLCSIEDMKIREIFDFIPLNYISGGMLGDFIHQLSIVNETYMETGIKANLFIANIGDIFRLGIEKTYNDTYELVKQQRYINDYKIFDNTNSIDINLSKWRNSPYLTKTNFYNVFKSVYSLEWGKNPWLILPKNDLWKDRIIINYTQRRKISNIHQLNLLKYGNKLIYMGFDKDGYDDLISNGINIEYYCPSSFYEFAVAINSCELFIGGLSAPLTLAFACHKKCIVGLNENKVETIFFSDLPFLPYQTS